MKNYGICKLTNIEGKFVKSHIIPQGLIQKIRKNEPFLQPMEKGRAKKNWTGWYDTKLVTREGEDILAELDSWAVNILRKNKLVWSSWGSSNTLDAADHQLIGEKNGLRIIKNINNQKLRLFFLSILWRAAESTLPEFTDIQLPSSDLKVLRNMLISGNAKPEQFYPIHIIQFYTGKDTYLITPIREKYNTPVGGVEWETFRFSFNGLVIHIENSPSKNYSGKNLGKLIVGSDEDLCLITQDFNYSREQDLSKELLQEHVENYIKYRS